MVRRFATVVSQGVSGVISIIYIKKKIRYSCDGEGRLEAGETSGRKIDGCWNSDGTAVFHHCDRNHDGTVCTEYSWFLCSSGIYGRK